MALTLPPLPLAAASLPEEATPPQEALSLRMLKTLSEGEKLQALGVDLSRYSSVRERQSYSPIETRQSRTIEKVLTGAFAAKITGKLLGRQPDPLMLTHIVTTRCNYSCGFCSFADSLNNKTNELSLSEIEQTYQTMGNSLHVIVYSGGETTVRKDLPDIIEAAYRHTPVKSVYIISNAWKPNLILDISHRIMQTCPELHLTWSLSIEGPKTHNNQVRYTQTPGWDAWQNTIDTLYGLKTIRETFGYNQLDVQLCTVCTPDNEHLLADWYEMIRDVLQPDKWNLNLMRKSVQMSDSSLPSFEARRNQHKMEPFEQTYLQLTQQVREDVLAGKLRFLYHSGSPQNSYWDGAMKSAVDLMSQAENRNTLTQQPPAFSCRAGSFGAFLGAAGEVSGCEEFAMNPADNKTFGNVRNVAYDFQAIWQSDTAKAYAKQAGRAKECQGCTLESQRNYPSALVSATSLFQAARLARRIQSPAPSSPTHNP